MIRRTVVSLTALMVAWHAIIGCCMHHVHASSVGTLGSAVDSDCCNSASNADALWNAGICSHGALHTSACDCPCDSPAECGEITCVLGMPTPSSDFPLDLQVSLQTPCAEVLSEELVASFSNCRGYALDCEASTAGSIRRHLAINVLLL